jgi:hypothetical protein
LWIGIEMYGKPRSLMTSLPISSDSIASSITTPTEETHPEAMFQLVMRTIDSPCINPT